MSFADYWVCDVCKSLNRDRSRQCYSCHADRGPGVASGLVASAADPIDSSRPSWAPAVSAPAAPASAAIPTVPAAAGGPGFAAIASPPTAPSGIAPGGIFGGQGLVTSAPPPAPPEPASAANVLGGLIGGISGAMIATLLWFGFVVLTHFQVGLIAVAVGAIVGYGVILGAGGRASFSLIPISLVLALTALVVSEYLIDIRLVNDELVQLGSGVTIPLVNDPADMADLVVAGIEADPLTLVFWGIALFEAFVIPWRRVMGRP